MFGRVTVRASDLAASERFYGALLPLIGIERDADGAWGDFRLEAAAEPTRRLHIGFAAPSRGHVDAFWGAGVDAGWRDDGAPGPRPRYAEDYYGGFLLVFSLVAGEPTSGARLTFPGGSGIEVGAP